MIDIAVVIPSLNPDDKLVSVVSSLISKGFESIIVVNDGSSEKYDKYFDMIAKYEQCIVLKHYKNLGKGRALKTAFNYYLNNFNSYIGLITVDADNQHHIDDICKCAEALRKNPNSLILGCRSFEQGDVPFKSKFGNLITKFVFKAFCGIDISDTQTGLRAIPTKLAEEFLDIGGERYDYETNMLIDSKRKNIAIEEVRIQTIYIEGNKSSHFNPLVDSLRIYLLIFKFFSSSFLCSVIDIGLFTLLMALFDSLDLSERIFISTIGARVLSSVFNFFANKNVVFNNKSNVKLTMVKYYILAVIQMSVSYFGVYLISSMTNINATFIKLVVDLILFAVSFQIQREWVFNNSSH